jgi:hypothetical protein
MRIYMIAEKFKWIRALFSVLVPTAWLYLNLFWIPDILREYQIHSTICAGSASAVGAVSGTVLPFILPKELFSSFLPSLPLAAKKINEEIAERLINIPKTEASSFTESNILSFYSALLIPFGGLIVYRILR